MKLFALAAAAALGLTGCAATDVGPDAPGEHQVRYVVDGTGGAGIAWNDGTTHVERDTVKALPWEQTLRSPGNVVEVYSLNAANASTEPIRLRCRIFFDGKLVDEQSKSGTTVSVTCKYKS